MHRRHPVLFALATLLYAASLPGCEEAEEELTEPVTETEPFEAGDEEVVAAEPATNPREEAPFRIDEEADREQYGTYAEWNENGDDPLTREEFDAASSQRIYDGWNQEEEGLTDDELQAGVWDTWDVDDDGYVTEDEWYGLGLEDEFAELDAWDLNDDGRLTPTEYDQAWDDAGVFGGMDLDGDGVIARNELNDGIFDAWDANDDDLLDESEWGGRWGVA